MVSPQTLAQNSVVKRIGIPLDTKIIIGSLTTNLWKTEKPQDTTRALPRGGGGEAPSAILLSGSGFAGARGANDSEPHKVLS